MADLVPAHLLHRARSFHLFGLSLMECKRGCERQILDEYRRVSEEMPSNHERRKAFLNILRKTPFYGLVLLFCCFCSNDMTGSLTSQSDFSPLLITPFYCLHP